MEKVRVLWISDAVTPTGFSRVSHSILKNLSLDKYDISWLGVNYYGDPHNYPFRIYPASTYGDVVGTNRVSDILRIEQPQLIFMLGDVWVLNGYLEEIKNTYKKDNLPKIIAYFPVDAGDHDPDWYKNFDIVSKAFVYSEYGKAVAEKACKNKEFSIIPHGVDTDTFYPLNISKAELRKKMFSNVPEDAFIVFNGNRNQPRKRIDITMKAFKIFSEDKPDNVKLYLHMGVKDEHINILKMAERLGIDDRLIISGKSVGPQKVTDRMLNQIYNACDVGINTSIGEGWGLVNVEHAVTGAPQIIPDHSTLTELYSDCGLLVPPITEWTIDGLMTTGHLVDPKDVAERIDWLYKDRALLELLSLKGLYKFTQPQYSWRTIAETWDSVFDEVLNSEHTVS